MGETLNPIENENSKKRLSELVHYYMAGDSHEHTVFSNPKTRHEADYTFEQVFNYVREEMKEGETNMQFVIFAEHPSDAGDPELVDGQDLLKHQDAIHEFMKKEKEKGKEYPELISGVETSIISVDGQVDVPEEILSQMDFVIASKHDMRKVFPENNGNPDAAQLTKIYSNLMNNPNIDVIGHPNRYVAEDVLKSMDWDGLITRAKESHTALEINVNAPMPEWLIQKTVEGGAPIFIGTDAHTLKEYQKLPNETQIETADDKLNYPMGVKFSFWKKMSKILRTLEAVDADPKQIITSSKEQLNNWLSKEKNERSLSNQEEESGETLAKHDLEVLRSLQTDWGTILAGPSAKESDPYDRVWLRDNALIAISLVDAGEESFGFEITEGLLLLMEKYQSKIKNVISEGNPYATERNVSLVHPAYEKDGKELDVEWGWRQNDAIGNLLYAVGVLNSFNTHLVDDHKEVIEDLVKYLEVVKYWEKDNGIWEWEQQVQTNTILSCVAGLRAISDYVEVPEELVNIGYSKAKALGENYSDIREYDLAHLNPFILGEISEPYIIEKIEHELVRDHGVIRYHEDHYMSGGKGHEAEWVLGLLMLGNAWLACDNKEKAKEYLDKADALRVNGDLPEAYIYKNGSYIANEHTPLAWCHALALSLRRQIENES